MLSSAKGVLGFDHHGAVHRNLKRGTKLPPA